MSLATNNITLFICMLSTLKYLFLAQVVLLYFRFINLIVYSIPSHRRYNRHLKFSMSKMNLLMFPLPKPAFHGDSLIAMSYMAQTLWVLESWLLSFTHLIYSQIMLFTFKENLTIFLLWLLSVTPSYFNSFITGYSVSTFVVRQICFKSQFCHLLLIWILSKLLALS